MKVRKPTPSGDALSLELIRRQFAALRNPTVRVTLQSPTTPFRCNLCRKTEGSEIIETFWNFDDIVNNFALLKKENYKNNVFITLIESDYVPRQGSDVTKTIFPPGYDQGKEKYIYLLIDDLQHKDNLLSHYSPNTLVQTSAESYQATWVLPYVHDRQVYIALATLLNALIGDDDVDALRQPGRLMGLVNRKPERAVNGMAPFMRLIRDTADIDANMVALVDDVAKGLDVREWLIAKLGLPAPVPAAPAANTTAGTGRKQAQPQTTTTTVGQRRDFGVALGILRRWGSRAEGNPEAVKKEILERVGYERMSKYDSNKTRYINNLYDNGMKILREEIQNSIDRQCTPDEWARRQAARAEGAKGSKKNGMGMG